MSVGPPPSTVTDTSLVKYGRFQLFCRYSFHDLRLSVLISLYQERYGGHLPQSEHSELDAHLIRALQRDGRKSVLELAREQGVSRHVVAERLQVLRKREGLRIVAALDPSAVGHHVLTHCMARVEGPVRAMADQVADLPNAVFVSVTSGDRPLVFESRHANSRELLSTLDQVRSISGVRDIRVTTYVDVLRGFFVARELKPIRLDALDHDLIAELQQDGRASYRTLADAIPFVYRRPPSGRGYDASSILERSGLLRSNPEDCPRDALPLDWALFCVDVTREFVSSSSSHRRSSSQLDHTVRTTSSRLRSEALPLKYWTPLNEFAGSPKCPWSTPGPTMTWSKKTMQEHWVESSRHCRRLLTRRSTQSEDDQHRQTGFGSQVFIRRSL